MFTLRKLSKEKIEFNYFLGPSYTYINREDSPAPFKALITGSVGEEDENIVSTITSYDGVTYYLYKGEDNFIMVDGKTVDRLTYR